MRNAFLAAVMFAASATPSFAAQDTVNSYTPAQEDKAKGEVSQAGYQPEMLEASQDGNFFFTAGKGSEFYAVTVTPAGQVYASTGLPNEGQPAG